MNKFQYWTGFLLFHWRVIAAILALIVVGAMVLFGLPAFSRFGGQPVRVEQANARDDSSNLSSDYQTGGTTGIPGNNGDEDAESSFERNRRIMSSTDPEVLISELMRVSSRGINESGSALLLVLSGQRTKIASRLLELELTEKQRRLATEALVESMLVKMIIGSESGKRFEAVEEEFNDLTERLTRDADPAIRSRIAMLWIMRDYMFFSENPIPETFENLNRSLEDHFDKMEGRPKSLEPVTRFLIMARRINYDQQQIEAMLRQHLKKLESIESEELKSLVESYRISLVFDRFKLNDIAERLLDMSPSVDVDVDQLFDSIQEFGNAPDAVYQLALDAIGQYLRHSRQDRVNELIGRYENDMLPKVNNADLRSKIKEILQKMSFSNAR